MLYVLFHFSFMTIEFSNVIKHRVDHAMLAGRQWSHESFHFTIIISRLIVRGNRVCDYHGRSLDLLNASNVCLIAHNKFYFKNVCSVFVCFIIYQRRASEVAPQASKMNGTLAEVINSLHHLAQQSRLQIRR